MLREISHRVWRGGIVAAIAAAPLVTTNAGIARDGFRTHSITGSQEISADSERQGDALMAEAERLGQRADQLEHAISGGGSMTGTPAMPPEKAAASAGVSANSEGLDQKKAAISNAISQVRSQQMKDWSDAEKLYQQAITASPDAAMLHVKRARALASLSKSDQQIAELRTACSLDPKNGAFAAELGDSLYDHKNWEAAEAQYKEAIRLQPDNALYHFDLGSVYWERKNWNAAEGEAKQAVTLEPGNEMYQRLYDKIQKRREKSNQ